MNILLTFLLFAFPTFSLADVAVIWENPMNAPNIIKQENGTIHAFACPPYTIFEGKSVQDLRSTCSLKIGFMRSRAFENALNSRSPRYYDAREVLTQSQIQKKRMKNKKGSNSKKPVASYLKRTGIRSNESIENFYLMTKPFKAATSLKGKKLR